MRVDITVLSVLARREEGGVQQIVLPAVGAVTVGILSLREGPLLHRQSVWQGSGLCDEEGIPTSGLTQE
jgi:hypothetical protein